MGPSRKDSYHVKRPSPLQCSVLQHSAGSPPPFPKIPPMADESPPIWETLVAPFRKNPILLVWTAICTIGGVPFGLYMLPESLSVTNRVIVGVMAGLTCLLCVFLPRMIATDYGD